MAPKRSMSKTSTMKSKTSKANASKGKTSKTRKPKAKVKAGETRAKKANTNKAGTTRKKATKEINDQPVNGLSESGGQNQHAASPAGPLTLVNDVQSRECDPVVSAGDTASNVTPIDLTMAPPNGNGQNVTSGDSVTEILSNTPGTANQQDLVRDLTRSTSEAFQADRERRNAEVVVTDQGLSGDRIQVSCTPPTTTWGPSQSVGSNSTELIELSSVLNQALQAHGSILSQLNRNESVIGQLQSKISQVPILDRTSSQPRSSMSVNPPASIANSTPTTGLVQNGISATVPRTATPVPAQQVSTPPSFAREDTDKERGRKRSREKSTYGRKRRGSSSIDSSSSDSYDRKSKKRRTKKKDRDSSSSKSPYRRKFKRARRSKSRSFFSSSSYGFADDESDSSEDDSSSSDGNSDDGHGVRTPRASKLLPPFTGKNEKWEVWYERFEAVASNHGWSTAKKLSALITLLRKDAGEFVFGSVSKKVRRNYKALVKELNSRYRTIESKRGYRLKWAELKQKHGQSVEELAAQIKSLYDKAFPDRDHKTRREDVVAKFFDALSDSTLKAQVQFVKDPQDIDRAVKEVVLYRDTYRAKKVRAVRVETEEEEDEHDEIEEVDDEKTTIRAVATGQPTRKKNGGQPNNQALAKNKGKAGGGNPKVNASALKDRDASTRCFNCNGFGHMARECSSKKRPGFACYECGKTGHMRKDCWKNPNRQTGQQPVAQNQYQPIQPLMSVQTGVPTYQQAAQPQSSRNPVATVRDGQGNGGNPPKNGTGQASSGGRGDGQATQQQATN